MKSLLIAAALLVPALASAQAVGPCSWVYFEFQVETEARFVADSMLMLHPGPRIQNPPTLVQVVVDTMGTPVAGTFRLLKTSDGLTPQQVQREVERWRFEPARVAGKKVCQLVQTPVAR